MTHLISLGEKMPIYKHSGQWHLFCYIKLLISTSFQSQSTLFWELFKWENICNLAQIVKQIVMFNNLFYVKKKILKKGRFLFVDAFNYSS